MRSRWGRQRLLSSALGSLNPTTDLSFEFLELIRQGGFKLQIPAVDGVGQAQTPGVQGLSLRHQVLGQAPQRAPRVKLVAQDGVSRVAEMDSDLVGSARF